MNMTVHLKSIGLGVCLSVTASCVLAAQDGQFTLIKETDKSIHFSADRNGYEVSLNSRARLRGTTKTQGDFNLSNRFSFEIDGVAVSGVHTIDGLESEDDVVEYKDGEDGTSHTRPGNHKPGKMTVTKDWSNTSEWYKWRKAVLDGKVDRRSISVIFHNDAGEEAGRVNLYGCMPKHYGVLTDPLDLKAVRKELLKLECTSVETRDIKPINF
jgi:phage tail-like protein